MVTEAAGLQRPVRRRRSAAARREAIQGLLCIVPWMVGFVAFTAGPMLASVWLSLTDYEILRPIHFTGLANFAKAARDPLFSKSLWNTAYYTALYVPLHLLTALLAALLLNVKERGINVYRVIYYVPSIMPTVANAFLWMWIFNPNYGLANALFDVLGLPPQKWLFDETLAKPSFVIMSLWGLGSTMIVFLAGLQGVDPVLYEASSIDGATRWSRFWNITLPMITPVVFFNLIVGIIGSFQVFTTAYITTEGGPDNATLFYVLYIYRQGWDYGQMGYASALAWVLFVMVLLLTIVQFLAAGRWVYYEAERQT
ncbi:MAG: carbohydrate ABC transporter permease [Anaerolineae bacterium]|mgnify:CR=1 FL=1|jgi:multiple sugar transport system permease protein